jgi:NAD(P)-dependent dehydrogenase (short-subunit alcohol dehydrogenase family)
LHNRGAHLVIAGRDEVRLTALGATLGDVPSQCIDASRFEAVENTLKLARVRFGRVDGIANCVGASIVKSAHTTSRDEWDILVRSNLDSAFATVRAAGRIMRKTGGSVVLVSAAAGLVGMPDHDAFAAVKAGVIGLTRSAAATYGQRGIRVNVVSPGRLEGTRVNEQGTTRGLPVAAQHALGKLGTPRDVARMVGFLLDREQSEWITGQVFGVDGGLSTTRPTRGHW